MGWPASCNIVISEYYGLPNIVLRITPSPPWVAWPESKRASDSFNRIPSRVNISFFVSMLLEYDVYFYASFEFRLTGTGSSIISSWARSGSGVRLTSEGQRWVSAAGVRAQSSESQVCIRQRSLSQITWHQMQDSLLTQTLAGRIRPVKLEKRQVLILIKTLLLNCWRRLSSIFLHFVSHFKSKDFVYIS